MQATDLAEAALATARQRLDSRADVRLRHLRVELADVDPRAGQGAVRARDDVHRVLGGPAYGDPDG